MNEIIYEEPVLLCSYFCGVHATLCFHLLYSRFQMGIFLLHIVEPAEVLVDVELLHNSPSDKGLDSHSFGPVLGLCKNLV
jgi:hypothetical protein